MVPSWDLLLQFALCMFYERLIPLRLQAKFSATRACVYGCVCIECVCVLRVLLTVTRLEVNLFLAGSCVGASC